MRSTDCSRSYNGVRAFLAAADIRPEFSARVFARIEGQHDELGESYLWSSLSMLVNECAQEAEDIAAWSALIAARVEHDSDKSGDDSRARALLTAAAQRAGEADVLLCELRRLVERPQ
jgi:hypothetical protein